MLRSAHSHTRILPRGSCQLIFVSLVHFASCGERGSFETILEPFVGLEEELIARRAKARSSRKTKSNRRDVQATMAVLLFLWSNSEVTFVCLSGKPAESLTFSTFHPTSLPFCIFTRPTDPFDLWPSDPVIHGTQNSENPLKLPPQSMVCTENFGGLPK